MPINSSSSSEEQAIVLNNAYWLKETLATDNPLLEELCIQLLNDIYRYQGTQRHNPNKHIPQLKVLILNLLIANEYHDGVIANSKARAVYRKFKILTYRVVVDLLVNGIVELNKLED